MRKKQGVNDMHWKGSQPLVSVIIPVYNVEKYLTRCLDSVINQTYENLDVILVNDGSTDSSGEICRRYAQNDPRISLFTQENQGLSAARNTGLNHMKGEYIVFVDSDDYISIHFIEIMLNTLLECDTKIVMCAHLAVSNDDDDADLNCPSLEDVRSCIKLRRDDIFDKPKRTAVWGEIYDKTIFASLRFEPGRIHEDEFIFHKIYMQVENVGWIDHALYAYRQSTNSIMRTNGVAHAHPDRIDAYLKRLSFFQEYGNMKFVKNTEKVIFRTLPDLMGQMGEPALKKLIVKTEQEICRITGKRVFSLKIMLFKICPRFYLSLRKYYRAIKAARSARKLQNNTI